MDKLHNLHPHGVFLRRDAVAAGYDDRELYGAVRAQTIVRVRQGAFVSADRWDAANEAARHLTRAHAVALTHAQPFALSHLSGAIVHGMRTWGVGLDRIHVSRQMPTVGRRSRDVAYHRMVVDDAMDIDGTPVLPAARCAIGAATLVGVEAGLVLLDSALDLGLCTASELKAQAEAFVGWPGAARLRITAALASPGSQSVGESRMRYLFWVFGLPKPKLQYVVRDQGEVVAIADFAWPEYGLLGEFDGRIKYGALVRPGETPSDAVFREKRREDRMREVTGWSVIRFAWSDLSDPRRTAERTRMALTRHQRAAR